MSGEIHQQMPDGRWRPATPLPYYVDPRGFWRKLFEIPFRLLGIMTYDPMVPHEFKMERNPDGSWRKVPPPCWGKE